MPKIDKNFTLEITAERFLDACSPAELVELDILIQSPRYRNKMKPADKPLINIDDLQITGQNNFKLETPLAIYTSNDTIQNEQEDKCRS